MAEESIIGSGMDGKPDFDFTLAGDYVSIRKYLDSDINMEIFRLKPHTGEVAEGAAQSSITYELFLLETIADHPVRKESLDYWINQISSGKRVKAKLHEFTGGNLFILEDESIVKPSETGSMVLKNLEQEIYGAALRGIPEENLDEPGALTVGGRKIAAPPPKMIYGNIRLFKEFETSESYPYFRPLPDGCEVKKDGAGYLLSIYGTDMVKAESGKFTILDVGTKCFDILSKPRESDDAKILHYLKGNGLIDSNNKTTNKGWDIYHRLKTYLPGRKSPPKSRSH